MKEFIKSNLPFLIPIKRKLFAWVKYLLSTEIQYLPSTDKLGFILTTLFALLIIIFFYQTARRYFNKTYALVITFVLIATPIFQALVVRNDHLLALIFTLIFLWWTLLQKEMIPRLKKSLFTLTIASALWQSMSIFYPAIFLPGNWQWQIATRSISAIDIYLVIIEQIRSFLHYSLSFFTPPLSIFFFLGVIRQKTSKLLLLCLLIFLLSFCLNLTSGKIWAVFLPAVVIFSSQAFQALWKSKIDFFWKESLILTGVFWLFLWQNSDSLKKTETILDVNRTEIERFDELPSTQPQVTVLGQNSGDTFSLVAQKVKVIPFWSTYDLDGTKDDGLTIIKADFETHPNTSQKKDIIDHWCVVGWTKQSIWIKSKTLGRCQYPSWRTKAEPVNFAEKFLLQDYQLLVSGGGKQISVKTLWQSIQETDQDYKIFYQLVGPSWHERNDYPLQGWLKTSEWQLNHQYLDEQQLDFSEAEVGTYVLGLSQEPNEL